MPKLDLIEGDKLSPAVSDVIEAAPLPGLGKSPQCETTRAAIDKLLEENSVALSALPPAAVAGLWLLAGELDRSHDISQNLDSPTGSYWHGIMHRREGDFSNAKYWMRRAAGHSAIEELASHIARAAGEDTLGLITSTSDQLVVGRQLTDSDSLATSLVDLCQHFVESRAEVVSDLQLICWWEWQLLFRRSL